MSAPGTEADAMVGAAIGRFFLAAALLAPYAVGWCVGFCVFIILWLGAAVVAGYRAGRGNYDDAE